MKGESYFKYNVAATSLPGLFGGGGVNKVKPFKFRMKSYR